MKTILTASMLLTLSACASAPLTQAEANVRLLRKSDAPAACKEVGRVTSPGLAAFTEQGREDGLKRATAKAGGDLVTLEKQDENGSLYGIAYNCGGGK